MGEKLPAKASDNWDLQAVVSCFSTAACDSTKNSGANSADPLSFLANMEFDEEDDHPFSFPNLSENNNGFDELQDSCRPFFSNPSSFPERLTCHQQVNTQQTHHVQQALQQQPLIQQQQQQPPMMTSSVIPLQAPRSRKRKTPIKKMVCQVKYEQLSMDTWAWRKYGQKPIKGSPYPRNYYRCSSSKGCGARKQVERSNTDPSIYIVSYTGDHTHPRPTHRNSLAGSTRNKLCKTTHQKSVTSTMPVPTMGAPPAPAVEEMNSHEGS
uniref:WRKY transcription factor protein 25 n=1 Tax=Zanthoxylum armatum TaxID=67938 RepID=A0A8F1T011_9ROSI|nr:WRKY transcription factor protein 25 [Zanthoxylum armatum]